MSPDEFYLVRAGQHDCFDRVVLDVNGTIDGPEAVGYSVAYVSGEVRADGSGEAVPTEGTGALEVTIRAPALGYGSSGHIYPPARTGDDFYTPEQLAGWGALREISFAGSFEGQSTIAIGVEAELPFHVGSFDDEGYSHLVVDVAHPREKRLVPGQDGAAPPREDRVPRPRADRPRVLGAGDRPGRLHLDLGRRDEHSAYSSRYRRVRGSYTAATREAGTWPARAREPARSRETD